ncbi:MAG: hypothetical protein RIT14_1603 [Pseudomonadota bacterium]
MSLTQAEMQDAMPANPPLPATDPDLLAAIVAALEGAADLALTQIAAEYVEGTVVLRGIAGSAEVREKAAVLARRVSGGATVENRIRVG